MKKTAFYADYIYYNEEIHTDSYLLVKDDIIEGITNNLDNFNDIM